MSATTVDLGDHHQRAIISLCCPQCGGERLHHGRVTVFHRIEDDEMITQAVVTGPKATVEAIPNSRTNPSSRCDGIEIEFRCEVCHWESNPDFANQRMFLRIAQHKRKTLLEWRFEDRETILYSSRVTSFFLGSLSLSRPSRVISDPLKVQPFKLIQFLLG
jgi:hypothetical protein